MRGLSGCQLKINQVLSLDHRRSSFNILFLGEGNHRPSPLTSWKSSKVGACLQRTLLPPNIKPEVFCYETLSAKHTMFTSFSVFSSSSVLQKKIGIQFIFILKFHSLPHSSKNRYGQTLPHLLETIYMLDPYVSVAVLK